MFCTGLALSMKTCYNRLNYEGKGELVMSSNKKTTLAVCCIGAAAAAVLAAGAYLILGHTCLDRPGQAMYY